MSCVVTEDLKNIRLSYTAKFKLFSVLRRETSKPPQFLELMKTRFVCGGNSRQRLASIKLHERNSLDPRKDNFLKLMMQSSRFSRETQDWNTLFLQNVQQFYHFPTTQLVATNLIQDFSAL
jgi:hypothetical protein